MIKRKELDVLDVAKYFIWISKNNISNKKLQKLLYYAQVWYLAWHDKKIFAEKIEAWAHGPVIPKVYKKYQDFSFNNIDEKIPKNLIDTFTKDHKKFMDDIWNRYGKYSADYLELLSHSEYPWQYARRGLEPYQPSKKVIDLELAKNFYKFLNKSK